MFIFLFDILTSLLILSNLCCIFSSLFSVSLYIWSNFDIIASRFFLSSCRPFSLLCLMFILFFYVLWIDRFSVSFLLLRHYLHKFTQFTNLVVIRTMYFYNQIKISGWVFDFQIQIFVRFIKSCYNCVLVKFWN